MAKMLIGFIVVMLFPYVALGENELSWEGVYEYSEGGETVTGVGFSYKRIIEVKRLVDGSYLAEVHDEGRMTSGAITVCNVIIDSDQKTLYLEYKGIKQGENGPLEPESGEFMTLTRTEVNGKTLFSVQGNFYPEAPEPYFEKIR